VVIATQKILTISEVAELLKVHPITVSRLIKPRKLPAFRIGSVLRFDSEQLEDWLRITQRNLPRKYHRRKPKAPSSAKYVAYRRAETFRPERSLETVAINRRLLVRSFVDAQQTGRKHIVCERCREARKPVAALLLFASVDGAKRPWEKPARPFCRACFAELRKLSSNGLTADANGRTALEAASEKDRAERGRASARKSARR
jgi:excisionase family DNA binding protein